MSNPSDKRVLNAILNPNTPFDDDEETKTDEAKSSKDVSFDFKSIFFILFSIFTL